MGHERATLQLSPDLQLPVDFATEGVAITGMRGSGKSNTEARWAEVLHDAGVPWAVVDPKGDWYGIRSSADGKSAGLPVPVFGGLHGDFPLEASLGRRIADLLVDENLSAVLDVSGLSKTGQLPKFLVDFCRQLMHRHQLEPHVRSVILEEAHRYIPQQVTSKTAELKEAAASLLLEGRAWGLGCWACTQRPARLHKDVLEEVGNAFIHAIGPTATNDKRTIAGWVAHYDISAEIVDSLTSLKPGDAWFLSPVALQVIERVHVDRRRTFDSASTPKVGEARRRLQTMADIDAGAIKEALAESIEKAKADDPKELRKQLAERGRQVKELERQLAAAVEAEPTEVEVPVLDLTDAYALMDGIDEKWAAAVEPLRSALERATALVEEDRRGRQDLPRTGQPGRGARGVERQASSLTVHDSSGRRRDIEERAAQRADPPQRREPRGAPPPRPASPPVALAGTLDAETLTGVETKLVGILGQMGGRLERQQLATLANYHSRAKSFTNALGHLRSLAVIAKGEPLELTDQGQAMYATLDVDPVPTGPDLLEHWKASPKVGGVAGTVLDVLAEVYPDAMSTETLAERVGLRVKGEGYHPRSKTFTNALGQVRGLGLAHGHGDVRLDEALAW